MRRTGAGATLAATLGATLASAAALALGGAASAQEPAPALHGPPAVAAQVLEVERAFAARSASVGAATAFAEYMDPTDSRAFLGGDPVRGAAAIARSHEGGRLAWSPREVFASTGGDMATVWGVWAFTLPGGPAPAVTGRYVTVWRKDARGLWKAIVDIGAPDTPAATS